MIVLLFTQLYKSLTLFLCVAFISVPGLRIGAHTTPQYDKPPHSADTIHIKDRDGGTAGVFSHREGSCEDFGGWAETPNVRVTGDKDKLVRLLAAPLLHTHTLHLADRNTTEPRECKNRDGCHFHPRFTAAPPPSVPPVQLAIECVRLFYLILGQNNKSRYTIQGCSILSRSNEVSCLLKSAKCVAMAILKPPQRSAFVSKQSSGCGWRNSSFLSELRSVISCDIEALRYLFNNYLCCQTALDQSFHWTWGSEVTTPWLQTLHIMLPVKQTCPINVKFLLVYSHIRPQPSYMHVCVFQGLFMAVLIVASWYTVVIPGYQERKVTVVHQLPLSDARLIHQWVIKHGLARFLLPALRKRRSIDLNWLTGWFSGVMYGALWYQNGHRSKNRYRLVSKAHKSWCIMSKENGSNSASWEFWAVFTRFQVPKQHSGCPTALLLLQLSPPLNRKCFIQPMPSQTPKPNPLSSLL